MSESESVSSASDLGLPLGIIRLAAVAAFSFDEFVWVGTGFAFRVCTLGGKPSLAPRASRTRSCLGLPESLAGPLLGFVTGQVSRFVVLAVSLRGL